MISLGPAEATFILFGGLLVLMFLGLPIPFVMGGLGGLMILLTVGQPGAMMIFQGGLQVMNMYMLIAAPMFIFMAVVLEGAGVVDNMFVSMRMWLGGIRGGLAIGVVGASTVLAAMSGSIATGIATLGIIALPAMLKMGYDKSISIGTIMTGGGLAFLIPPSIGFVIYGVLAEVSIGRLFVGGIIPGLMLTGGYILYVLVRCHFQPHLGPALPADQRGTWGSKFGSLKGLILPIALVLGVLLPIFMGVASATEVSSIGAAGALVCAAINRKFSWALIKHACETTFRITAMFTWVMIGAFAYSAILIKLGSASFIAQSVSGLRLEPLVVIFLMQLVFFMFGCFLDETATLLITLPVFLPIVTQLGFDPVWFGVLYIVNWQLAILTPPVGFALYYMKAVAPSDISLTDIIRSIVWFLPVIFVVLLLVMFFPQLATWLPSQVLSR